ncbi:unnamed protein product, partial [Notodromas monacha]
MSVARKGGSCGNGDTLNELIVEIWNGLLGCRSRSAGSRNTSTEGASLVFRIHVHFALLPIRLNRSDADKQAAMLHFKNFLDERKSSLVSEGDDLSMLPCFALPFVQGLEKHPTFQAFLEESWVRKLTEDIHAFWGKVHHPQLPLIGPRRSEPRLMTIFRRHRTTTAARPDHSTSVSADDANNSPLRTTTSVVSLGRLEEAEETAEFGRDEQVTSCAQRRLTNDATAIRRARICRLEAECRALRARSARASRKFNHLLGVLKEVVKALKSVEGGDPVNLHLTLSKCLSSMPEIFSLEMREKQSPLLCGRQGSQA